MSLRALKTLATASTLLAIVATPALAAGSPTSARAAHPARPAAECQPYSGTPCLFPYPDNRLTTPDRASITGLRVKLPGAAMPVNTRGSRVAVGPYDANDGFSPGSAIVVHVPGLDTAAALRRTGAVSLANPARYTARNAPIVVINAATGQRQPIWAQVDANATDPADADLIINPAKNFTEGDTYIVALRDLKTATGAAIRAPAWFSRLRSGRGLTAQLRAQQRRYQSIFRTLRRAGISPNARMYEAWNFTIASTRNLTGRMLAIRNSAFAQLGDHDLADLRVQGRAPGFTVTGTEPLTGAGGAPVIAANGDTFTVVNGTYQVPCYLTRCGPSAQPGFHYSRTGLYATPTQIRGNVSSTNFECLIPSAATAAAPARIAVYGHGLLGSASEVTDAWMQALASQSDIVFCATDFWGLAQTDTANDAAALGNLNRFPAVIDRLQQGALNSLLLGRLMLNPRGLASNPAFEQSGQPLIETRNLYYDGNSQGGILGGMLTALAPDWNRAVLGVSGMDFGNLLVQRSTDFGTLGQILDAAYPDPSLHPLLLDLMQQLWDRGDPDGYAQQMTNHPLPDTPRHQVLMQIAYGDFQVSMFAAAVEARTIGADAYGPALNPDRSQNANLFAAIPTISSFPYRGSAIEIWDSGPGRVQPPPFSNLAPVPGPTNIDPHEDVRNTPAAQQQMSAFWQPDGAVVNVCGGRPCETSVYTP